MTITKKSISKIPQPTLMRLCKLYTLLEEMQLKGGESVSSHEIGSRLAVGSHNVRKDIGYINEAGISGAGYQISKIKDSIKEALGFDIIRNACIIGLGNLGSLILTNHVMSLPCFSIVAGFDSNINTLETVKTTIPVYPTYEIVSILKQNNIEIAIIAEKDLNLDAIIARLIEGGIKGIINFTPVLLNLPDKSIYLRNVDIFSEFRYLSAMLALNNTA